MFTKTPLKTPFKNMGFFQNNLKNRVEQSFSFTKQRLKSSKNLFESKSRNRTWTSLNT